MDVDQLQQYCLDKKGTTAEFPFDEHTLVFKVMGKMFALIGLEKWEAGERFINLKCDPEYALELRDQFPDDITGAYHMSKTHWNTIHLNQSMDDAAVMQWIDHSYDLVIAGMTKKLQAALKAL